MQNYIMEAVGTFFLVLVFGFTGNAIAIGLILSGLVYVAAPVSGAHFNPAVTLAYFFKGDFSLKKTGSYILSQCSASLLAAIVIYFFSSRVFYVEPPYDTNLYQQAGAEVFLTVIFVWVFLVMMRPGKSGTNPNYGIIVGLTFAAVNLVGDQISGGVFNPAISLGPAIFDLMMGGSSIWYSILYTLAPFAGGAIAAATYTYFKNGMEA